VSRRRTKRRGKGGRGDAGADAPPGASPGAPATPGGDARAAQAAQAAFVRLQPRAEVLGLTFAHMVGGAGGGDEGAPERLSIAQLDALQEAHIRALAALADAKAHAHARQEAADGAEKRRIDEERAALAALAAEAGAKGPSPAVDPAAGSASSWAARVRKS